jgi:preprotein translocase subunit SecA
MFEHLLESVDIDYVRYITHVEATAQEEAEADADAADEGLEGALTNVDQLAPGATELPVRATSSPSTTTSAPKPHEKLGRNDPCWCGSKRKFKQCHGRS